MSQIISGFLGQISDGERVRTYLLTTAPYHDPALASLIEYGTALAVIPKNAGLSISEQIQFQPQGGTSSIGISQVPLINDEGEFDDWGGWILAGLDWTLGRGYADQPWSEWWKAYFQGRGKPEFRGRQRVMITLRDWFSYMRQPIARQVFGEDDVSNTRLINNTVPLVFGSAYQVKPLATEPQIQRYAVAANANDIPAVQAGGNPTTPVFEPVPLGFQLYQSPSLQITCDVAGPPIEGWEEGDVLAAIGDFPTWTSGYPDGWDVSEDAPYAVISETVDGYAQVENTAKIDGDTGWLTGASWAAAINDNTGEAFEPNPGTDSLADVLAADDGTYAQVLSQYGQPHSMTGQGWTFGLTQDVEPVKLDARITLETGGGNQDVSLYKFFLRYPDGTTLNLLPPGINWLPTTKTTLSFTKDIQPSGPYRLTRAILEDPDLELFVQVRQASASGGYNQTVKVHEVALKVHYGTVIDRLRLTTQSDVLTAGHSYLLRIRTEGGAGDSIKGYWGSVAAHADPIPASDNPYAQTSAQMEGKDVHEFRIVASSGKFAIEFDRGTGNGVQVISAIELIDKSASRERFKDLQRYLHELFDKDPDEVCDNVTLELVQAQAGNPRLGHYVDDQTTGEQVSVYLAHSLGATAWGGLHRKWTAAQMRVPQQPDGSYLSIEGSFGPGNAYPDTGEDLRDRVFAARTTHPLRDSETAGVTTTWPEEQRQLVISPWRITEKADWSNLVGYPTLTVSGIDPATGDTAGGTSVTITGTGFEAGATVTIGGSSATNVTVVSATEISCDTPSGTAGTVDVVVTVGGESATLSGGFEYAAAAWTPADTTTALWLKGNHSDTITLDGSSNVGQWDDKSGNSRHATQNTSSSARPSLGSINGIQAPNFDGDYMDLPQLPADTYTLFFVSECSTKSNVSLVGAGDNSYVPIASDSGGSNTDIIRIDGVNDPTDSYVLINGEETQSVTSRSGIHTALVDAGTVLSVFGKIPETSTAWEIGRGGGSGSWYWNGPIGEFIVIAGEPTTEVRQKVEGYLAHEWGMEAKLPSGHPYKGSPP